MHLNKIIHRDLKPENILLNQKSSKSLDLRICDFGLAISSEVGSNCQIGQDLCGTPGYISPEILRDKVFSTKGDIFSIGAMLYFLLTHQKLF